MNTDQKVNYEEATSIAVGNFLLSKKLDLANNTGTANHSLVQCDSLGILFKDPEAKPEKYLFGLFKKEPRRVFLGVIWFRDDSRGASKQNWVFEAYGRKYVELIRQLVNEMASTYNVKITIRLISEHPSAESLSAESLHSLESD